MWMPDGYSTMCIKYEDGIANGEDPDQIVPLIYKGYSEVSIIEKLPLEKNHKYLIIFLRTGQVQNNFYCTIILTYDLRFNT